MRVARRRQRRCHGVEEGKLWYCMLEVEVMSRWLQEEFLVGGFVVVQGASGGVGRVVSDM